MNKRLALSLIPRVGTGQSENTVDMLDELQALDAEQPETTQTETRPVRFAEGDVVALKHNWKHYLEPFFPSCSSGGPSWQL